MEEELLVLAFFYEVWKVLEEAAQKQRARRHYLIIADLPPQAHTAWSYLFRGQRDGAFIVTMGLDVSTFNYLRVRFEEELQLDKDIGRPPSVSSSSMLLGLTLHYLNSSMMQKFPSLHVSGNCS